MFIEERKQALQAQLTEMSSLAPAPPKVATSLVTTSKGTQLKTAQAISLELAPQAMEPALFWAKKVDDRKKDTSDIRIT